MAESQRIEDLRKRYHENPRRFFAPLANEYRKAGHLERALLLCEKHLKEQPDNMNGLVVYGQALFESEKREEAKEPLTAALGVDPENLIALRLLGDISRLGADLETAKMWYEKVLEVDRRNDEVLDLLAQMAGGESGEGTSADSAGSDASGPLVTVAGGVSISGGEEHDSLGMIDLDPPVAAEPPKAKVPAGPGKTVVLDAAALAAAVRGDATPGAASDAVAAVPKPIVTDAPEPVVAAAPEPRRPSKRASLLDVEFDFSELPPEESALAVPEAPVLGAEAAEYGFVDTNVAEPLITTSSAAEPPSMSDALATDGLMIETTGDVAPMAGLEPTEFSSEAAVTATPLAGLESGEMLAPPATPPAPPSAEDLPTVELTAFQPPEDASGDEEDDSVELPMLDTSSAPAPERERQAESSSDLPMLEPEPESRPRPRMTKASMSSLPLLADYGLEDDVPAPAAEAPRKPAKTPAFVTETMAALYLKQGYKDQAIEVYRQLIAQDPADAGLQERLASLERGDDSGLDFETPAGDAPEPTPAPANAVLDEVSFAEVGLQTPAPAAVPLAIPVAKPVATPAPKPAAMPVASGPSAREFFGAFARRGAGTAATLDTAPIADTASTADTAPTAADTAPIVEAPTVPAPAPAAAPSGWPLDALFGAATDVADLHAAEVIASVGTFEGPQGGTGLDELFSAASAPKATVTRASETLKFDQFFSPTGSAAPAAPEAAEAPIDASAPAAADGDDLDQFHGWLKGLKPQ